MSKSMNKAKTFDHPRHSRENVQFTELQKEQGYIKEMGNGEAIRHAVDVESIALLDSASRRVQTPTEDLHTAYRIRSYHAYNHLQRQQRLFSLLAGSLKQSLMVEHCLALEKLETWSNTESKYYHPRRRD